MTIDAIDLDEDLALTLSEWLQNERVGQFQRDLEEKIIQFLFDPDLGDARFSQSIQMLSWIGSPKSERAFLQREILALNGVEGDAIVPCELSKTMHKVGSFIARHKTEILIGAALCVTGTEMAAALSKFRTFYKNQEMYPVDIIGTNIRRSTGFVIEGRQQTKCHIGWINGINNTFDESRDSAAYIQDLSGGLKISGVYNCSHGAIVDILEAGLLNHPGYSPNTAELLQTQWSEFHEMNKDRPNARLLQICHSQGAIDVKNALERVSQEIRDRVIVVAIAPAAVVPNRLCFRSYNYASENDFVYKLEPPPSRPVVSLSIDDVIFPTFGEAIDDRGELIILAPHPEAEKFDHTFQSPTFRNSIKIILEDYDENNAEYTPLMKAIK